MKILNLTNSEQSDIKYQIQRFPDGQQNIVVNPIIKIGDTGLLRDKIGKEVQIKSRLNNWLDLEFVVCAVASLRQLGVEEIHLYTPYIVGARSDRDFTESNGGNNYLKDVICPIINSLNFKTVTCIDPHSDVLEACIKGFRKESNLELIKWATREIYGVISEKGLNSQYPCILISPDAGASKKIYKLAEQIGYEGDIITCSKDRGADGKLNKCIVSKTSNHIDKDMIIIDDICDGGATFINIAKELKQQSQSETGKIYLIVTHGIFSKGFEELSQYFDGIYCTNSYSTLEVKDTFIEKDNNMKEFVKQLNVF